MDTKESLTAARETLLVAIREAAAKTGNGTISKSKFQAFTGIKWRHFFKHFPSWSEALTAAGIACKPGSTRIDPTFLMEDCARVARLMGRMPSRREYNALGNFDEGTLSRTCGKWGAVAPVIRAFAAQRKEWADLLDFLPSHDVPPRTPRRIRRRTTPREMIPTNALASIPCGAPIDFGPLRHEPTNEQGVIFLFGIMAEKLGFLIEGFQSTAFPDCKAKRIDNFSSRNRWRDVKIEFEYESRNFRSHAHNPRECDLIVCWNHNWPDCPVEVLALKDETKKLNPKLPINTGSA